MSKKEWQTLNSDEIVQAVIVYDTFEDEFLPMSNDIPLALLPLINKPLVNYTLESLALGGVDEVFLFCCTHADAIKAHINNCIEQGAGWSLTIKVKIIVSESCLSYGDCLRDLDAKGLLRGYFVLVDPGTVCNVSLLPILKKHKELTNNKDKGAAMTLIYQNVGIGCLGRYPTEEIVVAIDETTKKVLFHKKMRTGKKETVKFPMEFILENPRMMVHQGLRDTHVAVCSPAALHLFTDNFDFQTKEDFIRGLLINEEILGSTIYCHVVQNDQFGNAVTNWRNYQALTRELINNWAHPIKPPVGNLDTLDKDVIVAKETILPKDIEMARSVIGKNVKIGKNCGIANAIVMDNVSIGDSVLINDSIVGPSCTIESECRITSGSVLGKGVVIGHGKLIKTQFLQATKPHFCEDKDILGEKAYLVQFREDDDDDESVVEKHRVQLLVKGKEPEAESLDGFSETEDEDSRASSAVPDDDVKLFFTEVIDSLTRGFEEKLPCDNMILEVNSSRYAYNVTVKEVNFNVAKAILLLSLRLPTGPQFFQHFVRLLSYFSPILKNYIRNEEAMGDALEAVEEVSISNEEVTDKWVMFVLKFFYEKDFISEDAVMNWYETLEEKSKLRAHVKPFTDWLKEAEEESSEDDD